jgi:transcriptional regulator with XRE-family HTH domain
LKAIFNAKKKELGLTQESLAERLGFSNQSGVSHYLNAKAALNLNAAMMFATELHVRVGEFSPSLQLEIDHIAGFASKQPTPNSVRQVTYWPFDVPPSAIEQLSRSDRIRLSALVTTYVEASAAPKPQRAA